MSETQIEKHKEDAPQLNSQDSRFSVKIYYLIVFVLCVLSVAFAIKDYTTGLNKFEAYSDLFIYWLFVADYLIRLFVSTDKAVFFKENIFDLLAIVPFNSALRAFRLFRFTKLLRLTKLARIGSLSGRMLTKASRFLDTNGFKYMLLLSSVTIVFASLIMTKVEGMRLSDALWWAFVTTTTVGYGDLSPVTISGRIVAIVLMVVGIGLLGSLTSTITSFFLNSDSATEFSTDKIDMVITMYDSLSEQEKNEIKSYVNKTK